jgi:endonuclease/exonuclease/phosphatase family metal-dependent hydrolase
LREVAPDALLLQELGIHEEGIPPAELEKVLLHDNNDYSLIANASYAILLKSSRLRLAGPSTLVSLVSGSQSWRMAQKVDVHLDLGEEFRLINFHIVSGQGIVAVKANYGRGADVAYNNHTLANGIRKDCATAVLAHGQRSHAAIIVGDFNTPSANMLAAASGYSLWGDGPDYILARDFTHSESILDRCKSDAHYTQLLVSSVLQP